MQTFTLFLQKNHKPWWHRLQFPYYLEIGYCPYGYRNILYKQIRNIIPDSPIVAIDEPFVNSDIETRVLLDRSGKLKLNPNVYHLMIDIGSEYHYRAYLHSKKNVPMLRLALDDHIWGDNTDN